MAEVLAGVATSLRSDFKSQKVTVIRNDALAFQFALKAYHQFQTLSGSKFSKDLKSPLARFAQRIQKAAEKEIIKVLGGVAIAEGPGGFVPDFYQTDSGSEEQTGELKLIKAYAIGNPGAEQIERGGTEGLGIAGGKGIRVRSGKQQVITGFKEGQSETEELDVSPFYAELEKAALSAVKGPAKSKEVIRALIMKDKAALSFKNSLIAKASDIHIPVIYGDQVRNKHIKLSFKNMMRLAIQGKATFSAIFHKDALKLNFKLTKKTTEQLLNAVDKSMTTELRGAIGEDIIKDIAEDFALMDISSQEAMVKLMKKAGFSHALRYLAGSVQALISQGILRKAARKKSRKDKKGGVQRFISGAQITAIVQQRLRKIMPQGPRRGPPLSPTTMTNRTGRFRRSIRVIPRYRQNVMRYMYDPIYMSLIDTPYNPDLLISDSIREVVQVLFGRQFAVIRGQ